MLKLNFEKLTYKKLASELLPHLEQIKDHCLLNFISELRSISEHP